MLFAEKFSEYGDPVSPQVELLYILSSDMFIVQFPRRFRSQLQMF